MDNKIIYAIDGYNPCGNIIEYQVIKDTTEQYIVKSKNQHFNYEKKIFSYEKTINKSIMRWGNLYFAETRELAKVKQFNLLKSSVAKSKKVIEDRQNLILEYEKKIKELTEEISNGN